MIRTFVCRLLATLTFFTRLPLWRIAEVPRHHYERVVPMWPVAGWVTGGLMALVFWTMSLVLPTGVAIVVALVARVLLTGGLHEDGFADFCDGFGGGTNRSRTLEIMKDSHIGTYGVLGLLLYFLLLFVVLDSMPADLLPWLFLCADTFGKWVSSNIIRVLPYARAEADAKNKLVYGSVSGKETVVSVMAGLTPLLLLVLAGLVPLQWLGAMVLPLVAFVVMMFMMKRRIQGYTGDCCGALFVVCELAFCLGVAVVNTLA